jgi:HD-like signal output (HDOD) protein
MDGAKVLEEVKRKHPGTVRIILSGYAEHAAVMRVAKTAHQFLAKPCSSDDVISVVARAFELRRGLQSSGLRDLVASIETLPTPPPIYLKLMDELARPAASHDSVGDLIAGDVGMTAEILKLINSAFFGIPQEVKDVRHAVRLLGFDTIRTLVLKIGIFRRFEGNILLEREIEEVNARAIRRCATAFKIAGTLDVDQATVDQAVGAAFLADIGALILIDHEPDRYNDVCKSAADGKIPLDAAERDAYGASHAELGAYLLGIWGFCDAVVEAVMFFPDPNRCIHRKLSPLTVVHAASGLLAGLGAFPPGSLHLDMRYLQALGIDGQIKEWEALVSRIAA